MPDRRQNPRDKVIYGGVAEIGEGGATRECVVRNISEKGARIEFSNVIKLPTQPISLTVARKSRSSLVARQFRRRRIQPGNLIRTARVRSRAAAAQERAKEEATAAPHQKDFGRRLKRAAKLRPR
jgi:hypothetical protein